MADTPIPELVFGAACPDCGTREIELPGPLPAIADDFDWIARDYDSYRRLMVEELAYRFPERRRWTPADMETVIVELLAAALDRASHALDTVHGERYLETARRPESVRQLLKLIGHDPTLTLPGVPDDVDLRDAWLDDYWRANPAAMNEARELGPTLVREQLRMVSLDDHKALVQAHPLVERARARLSWRGAWSTILISVMPLDGLKLDGVIDFRPGTGAGTLDDEIYAQVLAFHDKYSLSEPRVGSTIRTILNELVERHRMVGSEVLLEAAKEVPIVFTLSVRVKPQYFQSEMKVALAEVLSSDTGLFATGRMNFGGDLFASDILDAVYLVEGVETACLNRFKRQGARYPDRTVAGFIPVADDEIAVCFNRRGEPHRGSFRILVNGGAIG
ncbi:MAG: hypothetical protein WBA73_02860 [Devosia sp.]